MIRILINAMISTILWIILSILSVGGKAKQRRQHRIIGYRPDPVKPALPSGIRDSPLYFSYNDFVHAFSDTQGLFNTQAALPRGRIYTSLLRAVVDDQTIRSKNELAAFLAYVLFMSKGLTIVDESGQSRWRSPASFMEWLNPTNADFIIRKRDTEGLLTSKKPQTFTKRAYLPIASKVEYKEASLAIFGDERLCQQPSSVNAHEYINWRVSLWKWRRSGAQKALRSGRNISGPAAQLDADGLCAESDTIYQIYTIWKTELKSKKPAYNNFKCPTQQQPL